MARGSRFLGIAGFVVAVAVSGVEGSDMEARAIVLPANGQEVRADLSDPGLDGVIRIALGHRLRPWQRRLARGNENTFNDVGSAVSLVSRDFGRAAGNPEYDRRARTLTLHPVLPLPPGQYTLTVDGRLLERSRRRFLDGAVQVFRTAFTVGPDAYAPRIRDTTPAPLQMDTPRFFPISLVCNESLDPVSVVLGRTVLVEDTGTDPPAPVVGALTLENDGFLLKFTPDPVAGFPAGARIRVRLLGEGNLEAVRDLAGNSLEGDDFGEYSFEFRTKDL